MDVWHFMARILFVFVLSVIYLPLQGMNNNPPPPENNNSSSPLRRTRLSTSNRDRSITINHKNADEEKAYHSFIDSCFEQGMTEDEIFERATDLVGTLQRNTLPQSNTNITFSSREGDMEKMLSNFLSPEESEEFEQEKLVELTLPVVQQNKRSEIPQNKIPQVIQEKRSEKSSALEKNLARDSALAYKQRNELQQRADCEIRSSRSAQNMNRIAHQYDHLVGDPQVEQEIEALVGNFIKGSHLELINEYEKDPYNNNNLRASYITSKAIEQAKKISPVFASQMHKEPQKYEDKSLGQEISSGFKSVKTGVKYIFDSEFRKEFKEKERTRKTEKKKKKAEGFFPNNKFRDLTPQELEQAGEAQDKDQSENQGENKNQGQNQRLRENHEQENDHRKNQEKNQESEGNQGLDQQQQPKNTEQQNTGQQKQNAVEQNQAQQQKNSKSKENKIYGVNLVDKQGSMPWRIPLSLTHDEDKEFTPWHAPLILAHDEDKEFEEEPKQDYDQKQILNREHELQKKKEKLEREAKTSELQEKYEELKILECRIREQEDAVRKQELREQQRQAEKIEQQRQSEAQQKAQDEAELQKISDRLNQAIDSFYKPENFFAKTTSQQSNSNKDSTVSERLNQALNSFYDPKTFLSSLSEAQQKAREQERLKLREQEEKARIALEKKRLKYEKKQYEIRRGEQEFENLKACLENAKQLLLNARTLDQVNHAIQSFERIRDYASDDFLYAFDSTVEKQRRKIEKAQEKSQNRSSSDSSSNYDNREYDYGYQSSNSEYSPYQYSEREVEYRIASILTVPNWQRTPRERSFLNQYPDYAREVYQNTCYKLMDILNTNYYDRREAEDRFLEQYSWMIPKLKEQLNREFIQYQRENVGYHNWLYGDRIREILRKTPFEPSYFDQMMLSTNPMLTNLIAKEIEKERQQEQEAKDAKEAKEEFERQRRLHQQRSTQQNSQLQGNPSTQPQPTPASQQPRSAPAPVPAPIPAPRPIYVPEARKKLSARITGNYGDNAIRNRNRERLASIEQTVYSNSKMSYGYELSTNKNNPAPYRNRFHHVREGLYSHYPDTSYFTGNVAQIKSHQHQVEILNQTYRLYHQQVNKPFEANKNITVQNISNTAFRYLERATYANQYQNHERTYALEDFCHALNQTQLSLVSFLDGKESRVGNFFSSLFTQADYSTAFGNRLWDAITSNSTDENLNDLAWHNNQASTHLARALQNSYPTSQEFKNIILNRVPALLQAYNTNQPNAAQNIVRFATRMVFYGNGSAENYNHQNVQNQTIINDIVNAVESENRIAGNRNKNARHYGALRPLTTIFSNALQKCLDSAQAAPVQQPAPVVISEPIPQPSIDQPQIEPTITTPPVEPQVQPITTPQVEPTIITPAVQPTIEPITIPEPQPTRKKAAPKRKSGARISKARKKTAPKVTSKRKATDELENPRPTKQRRLPKEKGSEPTRKSGSKISRAKKKTAPKVTPKRKATEELENPRLPKQRRLPKEKGSEPTRKQPSRAVKQKDVPNITCTGSGPLPTSQDDEPPFNPINIDTIDGDDEKEKDENPYAQLIQQLEKEAQDLAAQDGHNPEQQLENLYQGLREQLNSAQESGDRSLIERCEDRVDALRETIDNPELILEIPANFDQIVLDHCDYTELFDKTHGTPLERQLQTELCNAVIISSYQLAQHGDNQQVQAIAPVIHEYAAIAANTNNPEAAFHLSDLCHGLTRLTNDFINLCDSHPVSQVARGIATGVCNSAVNYATYAFNNPGDVAIDLALGAICPPAVAVRHLCILVKDAYQHREDISQATQQFIDDIYDNKYHDPEWLAQHAQGFSQLFCDVFVAPRIGQKIAQCSTISPLANGLRKQKEVVQNCIRKGVNTAAQKAASSLETIFKEAADALKTGQPQPAFAGVDNGTHLNTVSDQPRRSERLMKKVGEAKDNSNISSKAKSWIKLPAEELKKVGEKSLQSDIRQIKGNPTDAFNFFKAQVETFTEREPGVFFGKDKNGVIFFFRSTSKSGPPTIDINGIKGLRKIKFLDE